MWFLLAAHRQRVNVYDTFIEGAKQGFKVAIELIPFLLAMLVAIGLLRASGAMDTLLECYYPPYKSVDGEVLGSEFGKSDWLIDATIDWKSIKEEKLKETQ
jgi:spore maturation protein SpmB